MESSTVHSGDSCVQSIVDDECLSQGTKMEEKGCCYEDDLVDRVVAFVVAVLR